MSSNEFPTLPVPLSPLPKEGNFGQRRDEIVEQYLLRKITEGEIPPGTKLPSTAELASQMEVNINSVQKALMRLSARGFLARKPNVGTIVNSRDGAPTNVFILIGPSLRDERSHLDRRLSCFIEEQLLERGYNPIIYDGLDQILDRNSSFGPRLISRLLSDFNHFDPKAVVEQNFVSLRIPELARGGAMPMVAFRPLAQGGDITFDGPQYYYEAVRAAAERGRTNALLVLKNPKVCLESLNLRAFWKAVKTFGVTVSKILHVDDGLEGGEPENMLEEVLTKELREWKQLPPRKRPDTLILMDDILMRSAALCLLREGISVPDELLAVSMVNEDVNLEFGIPVVGIETPLSAVAEKLADVLDVRLGRAAGPDPAPVQLSGRIVNIGAERWGHRLAGGGVEDTSEAIPDFLRRSSRSRRLSAVAKG